MQPMFSVVPAQAPFSGPVANSQHDRRTGPGAGTLRAKPPAEDPAASDKSKGPKSNLIVPRARRMPGLY